MQVPHLPSTRPTALTLRALARLIAYPDAALREHLGALRERIHDEAALDAPRVDELDALIDGLLAQDPLDAEADYVQLFDSGRRTALHLFEHVHGESRDRGPAMIDLAQMYERAGLYLAEGEMPDHLAVVLEFASTQPPRQAAEFLGEIAHLINAIHGALEKRESRYASVMGALLDLAGASPEARELPEEEPLDQSWAEPAAFGGCDTSGQAAPGKPQPIQIVRRTPPTPPGAHA